MTQQENLKN